MSIIELDRRIGDKPSRDGEPARSTTSVSRRAKISASILYAGLKN